MKLLKKQKKLNIKKRKRDHEPFTTIFFYYLVTDRKISTDEWMTIQNHT